MSRVQNDFGARLRAQRELAGKTRAVLGGLVGRSEEWVKAVETGRILQPRVAMLMRLAEVLGIRDLADLIGSTSIPIESVSKATSVPGDEVAAVMLSHARVTLDGEPDAAAYTARVDQAWQLWHHAPAGKSAIVGLLPGLLRDGKATVAGLDGMPRRQANAALARTYHLCQQIFAYTPKIEMLWLAVDRAMTAAQDADDPAAIAAASWYYSHLYRASGQLDKAVEVVELAATELDPTSGDVEQTARWGKLKLAAARTHSKAGDEGLAWRNWDAASRAAAALPSGYIHPWLMFGAAEVGVTAIGIEADLIHPGRAVRRAGEVDMTPLPAHRRAAVYIDVARAYRLTGNAPAVMHMLGKAARESTEMTEREPFVRAVVADLMESGGIVAGDARELALVIGLLR